MRKSIRLLVLLLSQQCFRCTCTSSSSSSSSNSRTRTSLLFTFTKRTYSTAPLFFERARNNNNNNNRPLRFLNLDSFTRSTNNGLNYKTQVHQPFFQSTYHKELELSRLSVMKIHSLPDDTHEHYTSIESSAGTSSEESSSLSIPSLSSSSSTPLSNLVSTPAKDNQEDCSELLQPSTENEKDESTSIATQIFSLALPAFLALSIDPIMALVDTAFIGKSAINADALAGVGTASGLLTFTFYLFNFLTSVTTPMVSQKRASGNLNDAVTIGGQALTLSIILGTLLTTLLVTFSNPLLSVMGVNNLTDDVTSIATSFLQIRACAATAIFVSSASTGILRGFLDTQTALVILLGSNIINLSLDFLLITYAHMGPTGAAIATTMAEYCAAFGFLGVLGGIFPSADGKLVGSHRKKFMDSENQNFMEQNQQHTLPTQSSFQQNDRALIIKPILQIPSWNTVKPLIIASSSSFLRSFVLQIVLAGATAMATRSGNNDACIAAANIAAHQISLQLWLLCSFICDALAAASQALISDAIARNDTEGTRNICKSIFMYSLTLGIFLSGLLYLSNENGVLFSIFTNDRLTQESLKHIILILTLSQPLNAYVFAADGILQGASEFVYEAKSMMLSASIAVVCFFILEANTSTFNGALDNVWYALVSLMGMRGLTATYKIMTFF
jgi:Na+-driven multidrug efflux pump